MKVIYSCWNCKKEHKADEFEYKNGAKCECGGYIVTPSGKVSMKVLPEDCAEPIAKPILKVYKMNDCDTVVSPFSIEATNEWYKKESDLDDETQPIEDVKELESNQGFWSESGIGEITECVSFLAENKELKVKRLSGCLFLWTTFEEVINENKDCNEPFVVCSTEF